MTHVQIAWVKIRNRYEQNEGAWYETMSTKTQYASGGRSRSTGSRGKKSSSSAGRSSRGRGTGSSEQDNGSRQPDIRYQGAPMRRRRVLTPTNLLAALVGFLFIFSLSVVLTLNLRSIYYFDIRYQNLVAETGLSETTIRENYDTLIDYNLITKHVKTLEFPDFPMSEHGRTHFAEVKRIFVAIQYLCIVSGVILVIVLFRKLRKRDYGSLKLTSIFTFLVPLVLGILAALNWNAFFLKFHELFFNNNYWIFDPVTDPVITILPDAFFLHCAVMILLFLFLGCILTGALYRILTGKSRRGNMPLRR
jgi:integral membrane protein (TIGR01906 family)